MVCVKDIRVVSKARRNIEHSSTWLKMADGGIASKAMQWAMGYNAADVTCKTPPFHCEEFLNYFSLRSAYLTSASQGLL